MRSLLFSIVALVCLAPTAVAVPSLSVVDYGNGTAGVQVVLDAPGAIGVEVAVEFTHGLTLTSAQISDTVAFDTPNPGDNPFLPGSPIGGDTTGLWTELENGHVFASFGGPGLAAGVYELLTLGYENSGGLQAEGYVAQNGVLGDLLLDSFGAPPMGIVGDTNDDGFVSTLDIDPFVLALTNPAAYDAMYPGIRVERADINMDLVVNTLDIQFFVQVITGAGVAATPEPASLAIAGALGGAWRPCPARPVRTVTGGESPLRDGVVPAY
ncbi:hypothetical protein Pla123a_06590 [Posidoniimonas polymericola]|uniref:Dockerin domain-containing protein n=1 Tax=Posidoniimonas polymericola TaxID=2528002 RepID=A0A5C5ZEV5_9BACT|nr:hypothetical protein [Posidoniimonas polymericola]TWT85852.1 hypothetical protein Pla123a_06590 [Posidoniimonas polymericola]